MHFLRQETDQTIKWLGKNIDIGKKCKNRTCIETTMCILFFSVKCGVQTIGNHIQGSDEQFLPHCLDISQHPHISLG